MLMLNGFFKLGRLWERVDDIIDGYYSSMYPEPSSSYIGPVELYLAVGGMECLKVGIVVIAVFEFFLPAFA